MAKAVRVGERYVVKLRADPIARLSDADSVIRIQSEAIGLKGMASNLVLAPELYSLTLIERPTVADDELKDAVRWLMREPHFPPARAPSFPVR